MTQPVAQPRHAVARSGFANPLTLGIKVTTASFVKVYADDMLLQLGFDYTIDGLGDPAGIEITIIDGEDAGAYVDVTTFAAVFSPLFEQGADLSAGGNFGLAFESAIDALNRQIQALDDRLRRSLTLPPTYESDDQLSFPLPMAGRVLVGNATNTGFENGATLPEIETIVGLTDEILVLTGIAPQIVEVASLDTEIVGLYAVAASIGALGPIAANITALAPQAANIATLAPQAANIGLVGGSIASVVIVANAIANVNIVATNITSVNTAAANIAAIIAAPSAATAAANSATAANNSAIAAAASAASIDIKAVDVRRNLIVNGSMALSQENGNTLGTTTGYYPADQFALFFTAAAAAMSVQRVQARTLANALDQIEFKTTTAKASLAAGDSVTLTQNIEGSAIVDAGFGTANAKPLVLRAQVQLPAGLYHFHFQNSAGNRHCAVPFTVTAGEANAAVVKTITIPADTSGTWLTADGVIGLTVDLVLAVGTTKTGGSASTWGATAYLAASTQFNILSSTANVARLADVGLKLDPTATGVYGVYRVNEVDAMYRSERYVELVYYPSNGQIFLANNSGATAFSATYYLKFPKAVVPVTTVVTGAWVGGTVPSAYPSGHVISFYHATLTFALNGAGGAVAAKALARLS